MGEIAGFLEIKRKLASKRPILERIKDYKELYLPFPEDHLRNQAARCMECGTPFCHDYTGCPLGNLIPDWNDLMNKGRLEEAIELLHKTNNFPEFTGRVCPAPCETACVLGLIDDPVTIKQIEKAIIEEAFSKGLVRPIFSTRHTGVSVAVVGSGPSGLAAAQQLARAGFAVSVFEKSDRIGGLLRYGIPDFKLNKAVLDRRLKQLEDEGIEFNTSVNVGVDVPLNRLKETHDAVLLAIGAEEPRDMDVPGRKLKGIHFAMDYLTQQNRLLCGDHIDSTDTIDAKNKVVVIIGGGDTGADCLGTAHRQGAKHVYQFEILPKPPSYRSPKTPWPYWPYTLRASEAHEEGGERRWSVLTKGFKGENGHVKELYGVEVEWINEDNLTRPTMREILGSEFCIQVDLVIFAMGFIGPNEYILNQCGLYLNNCGILDINKNFMTEVEGVFVAGDVHRGASLVVWAIWEGRQAAKGIDAYLKAK